MDNFNKIKFTYFGFLLVLVFSITFWTIKLIDDYKDKKSIAVNGIQAQAVVSNIERDNFGRYPSNNLYLKYNLKEGTTIESKYRRNVGAKEYKVGQILNIVYDSKNPKAFFFVNDKIIQHTLLGLIIMTIILSLLVIFKSKIFKYYNTP